MDTKETSSKVKIINYSQMMDENYKNMSLIDQVAYFARVSNPNNQSNSATSERLCMYLLNNKHFSPFEMVTICLEIKTTRDIARQILRHRSFSFQEFSQRYAVADLGYEYKEARLQDNKNRQNSIELEDENLKNTELKTEWKKQQTEIAELSKKTYNWALEHGIAKEQARAVLPEGMTLSRMYMSGNLRSWIHYIQLRTANGTQKEHREIAFLCAYAIKEIFPFIQLYLV
jgi:thymidylate synthase (FAD)